ncbi:MAG: hypothetical protein JXA50_01820 [Deltaproteobacteria bacterium]|nr:hypothetical protein [Deltaproteobacteria bacterium]
MNYDILLDGTSIKNKVTLANLHKGRKLFCKELTLNLHDKELYKEFNFKQIPAEPRIEVLTEGELGWISEGKFFVEQNDIAQDKDKIIPSLWGRDISARLTFPFAVRISKEWPIEAMLFEIFQEIIEGADLEYNESRILINNYQTYPSSYAVTSRYPLEILIELISKTDGLLYTDRLNQLWILKDTHSWDSTQTEIHGGMIQNITERVVQPEFGNRIYVGSMSKEGDANVAISLEMESTSVACGESVAAKAVVTFLDGTPAPDGYAVDWTTDNPAYANWQNVRTHVYTHRIPEEAQSASGNVRIVSTKYPIRQVHSVTEVDTGETKAVKEFKGRSITLDESLTFTNSAVIIDYETAYAVNTLIAGSTGEVEVPVHAIVEVFVRDTVAMRIDTESGDQTGDQAMFVTLIYKDFVNKEPIGAGIIPIVDGQSKAASDENGETDLGLLEGGAHSHKVSEGNAGSLGYKGTEGDGLANDEFRCSTQ